MGRLHGELRTAYLSGYAAFAFAQRSQSAPFRGTAPVSTPSVPGRGGLLLRPVSTAPGRMQPNVTEGPFVTARSERWCSITAPILGRRSRYAFLE